MREPPELGRRNVSGRPYVGYVKSDNGQLAFAAHYGDDYPNSGLGLLVGQK